MGRCPVQAMASNTSQRTLQVCTFSTATIWLYQGIVPKLLGPHRDEIAMIAAAGVPSEHQATVAYLAGAAEVALGLCILLARRRAWPHVISAVSLVGLLAFVVLFTPAYLRGAFNAMATNIAVLALSVIAILIICENSRSET